MILHFPLLLTIGTLMIPFVKHFGDHESAENAVTQHPNRWLIGHLIVAAAFGLSIVNITRIAEANPLAILLAAIGGGIQAAGLGADGVAPVVLLRHGLPPRRFFAGSSRTVPATFIVGSLLFGLAQILMIVGVNQAGQLPFGWGIAALLAAIGFSALPAIPSSWSLYGTAALSWLIYLPLQLTNVIIFY